MSSNKNSGRMKPPCFGMVVVAVFSIVVLQPSTAAAECTPKLFRGAAEQCASQFFDEITTDATLDCSLAYQTLVNCIQEEKQSCVKRCSSEWTPQEIAIRARSFTSNEDHFCKKGMLKHFAPAAIKGCTEMFYRKAGEVSRRFHATFQRDRNSSELCRLFTRAAGQMKTYLQDYCTPTKEVTQIASQYADTYNPYCKKGKTFLEIRILHRCTKRSYEKRVRKCTAKFMEILRENGGTHCTSAFSSYHSCNGAVLKYCLEGFYTDEEELSEMVNNSLAITEDADRYRLCDDASMAIPYTSSGQCRQEYREGIRRCGDKMSKTYKADRVDPSLCGEYAKAKICAANVVKSMCNMTKDMEAFVEFYYDDFNPFSTTLRDTSGNKTFGGATKTPTASQTKTEHPPVHLLLAIVVLVWIF